MLDAVFSVAPLLQKMLKHAMLQLGSGRVMLLQLFLAGLEDIAYYAC